jgi:hypothetical protein
METFRPGRRAQTNVEFVLFLTVVLAMVMAFAVPAFQSYEANLGMSAVRASLGTFVTANRTLTLGPVYYAIIGNNATLRPHVYNDGARLSDLSWADAQAARTVALRALAKTFHQDYPDASATSVRGFTYTFTIDFTN